MGRSTGRGRGSSGSKRWQRGKEEVYIWLWPGKERGRSGGWGFRREPAGRECLCGCGLRVQVRKSGRAARQGEARQGKDGRRSSSSSSGESPVASAFSRSPVEPRREPEGTRTNAHDARHPLSRPRLEQGSAEVSRLARRPRHLTRRAALDCTALPFLFLSLCEQRMHPTLCEIDLIGKLTPRRNRCGTSSEHPIVPCWDCWYRREYRCSMEARSGAPPQAQRQPRASKRRRTIEAARCSV